MSRRTNHGDSLENRVSELEKKAHRIRDSKDTEDQLESATEAIARICKRLETVHTNADQVRFYVWLLEGAFDEDRSETVQEKINSVIELISITDGELLSAAEDHNLQELEDRVESAENNVDKAIEAVKTALEQEQGHWIDDLDAAQELNAIIGGGGDFDDLIRKMRSFLTTEIWNPRRNPSDLAETWDRYKRKWKKNTGKHGWETFQHEHDLADRTVNELKQFGEDEPVRLSDLSIETLEEVKRVKDLEDALQLEVRRR